MKKEKIINWIKEHKKQLIIAGCVIGATILGIVIYNYNKESLVADQTNTDSDSLGNEEEELYDVPHITVIPKDIYDHLTGNRMTATQLGKQLLYSARIINERIVESGLAVKNALGEYDLTELGQGLGEKVYKETRYGWPFSNIEWDEIILTIIFTPEELAERRAYVAMIRKS
ncbi:MAG: hypothetical protein IJ871_02105 [Ruminococcus sp.]|nr:hypothetical protein [Ruminococcus sp.]